MAEKCDVLIIGAGPAGYVAAIRSAQLGLNTIMVEKDNSYGGTCLNQGCIPSKTLLHFSEKYFLIKEKGEKQGFSYSNFEMNFSSLMNFKEEVIRGLNQGIGGLLKKNKIKTLLGDALLKSSSIVEVKSKDKAIEIETKNIILATGSEPVALPFLPFDEKKVLSSKGALAQKKVPKKIIVIGAGVIGLELGSVYHRLGSKVTFVEFFQSIGGQMDKKCSKILLNVMMKKGFEFHFSSKVVGGKTNNKGVQLEIETNGEVNSLEAESVLVSIGRRPYTQGLGLDHLEIKMDEKQRVIVDENFKTNIDGIYAIGDIIDGPMLAHKASHEGVAVAEIIANQKPKVNYLTIPNVVYTSPEVASVGLTEEDAKDKGIDTVVGSFSFRGNSRAHCVDDQEGIVSLVFEKKSEKILGLHMVGPYVSELVVIGSIAIEMKMSIHNLAEICFPHPTFSEAIHEAALNALGRGIHM